MNEISEIESSKKAFFTERASTLRGTPSRAAQISLGSSSIDLLSPPSLPPSIPSDWLRGNRQRTTSGVQRSCEVLPTSSAIMRQQQKMLVKQNSKESDGGSVSSEGSK